MRPLFNQGPRKSRFTLILKYGRTDGRTDISNYRVASLLTNTQTEKLHLPYETQVVIIYLQHFCKFLGEFSSSLTFPHKKYVKINTILFQNKETHNAMLGTWIQLFITLVAWYIFRAYLISCHSRIIYVCYAIFPRLLYFHNQCKLV